MQVKPEDEAAARKVLDDFEADPETMESVDRAESISELGAPNLRGAAEIS